MKRMLEICVDSLESALIAQEAGADRVELCSCLEVGGLTPDPALFLLVRERVSIPVHVLIRPRIGNFVYSAIERLIILKSIEFFKQHKADAVVVGALQLDSTLDLEFLSKILDVASSLSVTFHRAFDLVDNPLKVFQQLGELGVPRVLTSGQKDSAAGGIPLLKKLVAHSSGNAKLLAGGGVNNQNVVKLLEAGITEVHASARKAVSENIIPGKISLSRLEPDEYRVADFQEIVNLRNQLDHYQPYVQ
ncbi:MAG: copper homeostasis protein CutC [Bacteroidota bacterium]